MELDPLALQQAALASDPAEIAKAVSAAIDFLAATPNLNAPLAADFLNNLAKLSPTCNANKNILQDLTQTEVKQQIRAELMDALETAKADNQAEAAAYAQRIQAAALQNKHPSAHRQSILEEYAYNAEKSLTARRDKAWYDLPAIGHLIESLLQLHFIVPVDEKYFGRGGFKFVAPTVDEYEQHMRDQHGDKAIYGMNTPTVKF